MAKNIIDKYLDSFNTISDIDFIKIKNKIKDLGYNRFLSVNIDKTSILKSCRHCDSSFFKKWGRRNGMQRYKCNTCNRTFNTLTNTPLSRLQKKEKWVEYAMCLKQGFSIRKAAEVCGIHSNTSFKWRHRFLHNSKEIKAKELSGIVEMDSIFMIKSYKGCKSMPRTARSRGLTNYEKLKSKEKFSVFFIKNRASYIYDKIFTVLCTSKLDFSIDNMFKNDNLLCSKKDSIYKHFSCNKILQHSYVKIRANRLKNKIIHIRNVEQYYSNLLNWMQRFNGVSTKYLDSYLSWYRFLDEFDMSIKPEAIILRAHIGGRYKHQPLFTT